jgi:hypothetical protein
MENLSKGLQILISYEFKPASNAPIRLAPALDQD